MSRNPKRVAVRGSGKTLKASTSTDFTSMLQDHVMETDCVGFDLDYPLTQSSLNSASAILNQTPMFCGRYFKGPGNRSGTQYQANKEEAVFQTNHLRILPLARQTAHVGRDDQKLGEEDGQRNAAAMLEGFGAVALSRLKNGVLVFLDVEPNTPLNAAYFKGWSEGLIEAGKETMIDFSDEIKGGTVSSGTTVRFLPAVYGHHADATTWKALDRALNAGATCEAAWMVYFDQTSSFPIGPWRAEFTSPYIPNRVRMAICQRVLDYKDSKLREYDFNLVNPVYKDWLLERIAVP